MFVDQNVSVGAANVSRSKDLALIGPNTQTYATLRPVIVYGEERVDIQTTTSNFLDFNRIPFFGYWVVR